MTPYNHPNAVIHGMKWLVGLGEDTSALTPELTKKWCGDATRYSEHEDEQFFFIVGAMSGFCVEVISTGLADRLHDDAFFAGAKQGYEDWSKANVPDDDLGGLYD